MKNMKFQIGQEVSVNAPPHNPFMGKVSSYTTSGYYPYVVVNKDGTIRLPVMESEIEDGS